MKPASTHSLQQFLQARQQALIPQAQQLPPAGSRPLTVAGRVAGWATARATSCLAGQPGVLVDHEAVHITAAPRQGLSLNAVFERVAVVLRQAGCLRAWRGELLDVTGEGRHLAVLERAAFRPLGLLTKAVHLNAWSAEGELWLARRADTKATDPGLWDTLVGGLSGAGETLDTSLLRESNEEAGLTPPEIAARTELRVVTRMHRRLPEGYQVEDLLVSDCILADDVRPENIDGEVSEIRKVNIESLVSMLEANLITLEAELVILEGLQRRLTEYA